MFKKSNEEQPFSPIPPGLLNSNDSELNLNSELFKKTNQHNSSFFNKSNDCLETTNILPIKKDDSLCMSQFVSSPLINRDTSSSLSVFPLPFSVDTSEVLSQSYNRFKNNNQR